MSCPQGICPAHTMMMLPFLGCSEEEEIERLQEIERNRPVGIASGPCMVYRCKVGLGIKWKQVPGTHVDAGCCESTDRGCWQATEEGMQGVTLGVVTCRHSCR